MCSQHSQAVRKLLTPIAQNNISLCNGTETEEGLWKELQFSLVDNFELNVYINFQDSPDNEEDTRSSQEYMNGLEEEYQARALLAKSKRFFKKEVSSDDNEVTKVKALLALADEERVFVAKESARNGE
ncbi:hypothetical protein Tco_0466497 [Tanacetum coccineum]